ncbi:MAG: S24 family peptidase, partial [Clostridiales bacterium]
KYFLNYKNKNNFKFDITYDSDLKRKIIIDTILNLQKKYPKLSLLDPRNVSFFMDEIDWIKSCNYLELEEYQNVDRLGRMSGTLDGPQRLIKNSDVRAAIFELLLIYNNRLQEKELIDFKSASVIALEHAKKYIKRKYTHIIVDEGQDLTRVQIEMLKLLYCNKEYSSFSFVADTAQSIYNHSWMVKGRSYSSIGFNMLGKSNTLTKNYRTTTQIAEAAYSLLENDLSIVEDENYVKPSLIDKSGVYPVFKKFSSEIKQAEFIRDEIKYRLLKNYNENDIAIISKSNNQVLWIEKFLKSNGINADLINKDNPKFAAKSIKIMTMHSIKGLEYKVVFVFGINEDSFISSIDNDIYEMSFRKLLYVSMTRANEILYLTCSKKPSKLIYQINQRYLRIDFESKVKRMYKVDISEYKFVNKISDIYSKEEIVRQWMISEIMKTYEYPETMIDVEFKVYNFSKQGFVDIVVNIYNKNNKIPYIFIETKRYNSGITEGLGQLKSYMESNVMCQYGISTDGVRFEVINSKFEKVNDIPNFHPSMLPDGIETYQFIDFQNRRNYLININQENKDDISITNIDTKEDLKPENFQEIRVFGEIIAGEPRLAYEDVKESFPIPNEWLSHSDDYFFLKVVGDSMNGIEINIGDYVLIKKQNTAINMDIVVVSIDENATLKKLMVMGDSVLLISENPDYEPIQMRREDVLINGVAIAVLKRNLGEPKK